MHQRRLLSAAFLAAASLVWPAAAIIKTPDIRLDVGAACDTDAQCSTGFCSFPTPLGTIFNDMTKVCRKMPFSGPCTLSAQCSSGNCNSATGTCDYDPLPNGPCEEDIDCLSGACSLDQTCFAPPGASCSNPDLSCGNADCIPPPARPGPSDDVSICGLLPAGSRCSTASQCQSGRCGDDPASVQCGLSLQADGTLLRSERCFAAKYCLWAQSGNSCTSSDECGNLLCDPATSRCGLVPSNMADASSTSTCDSHMWAVAPYGTGRRDYKCAAFPAGTPCTRDGVCGSKSCDLATGTCASAALGGPCFWTADCAAGSCDVTGSFTCVDPSSTTTTTTTTVGELTSTSTTFSTTTVPESTFTSTASTSTATPTSSTARANEHEHEHEHGDQHKYKHEHQQQSIDVNLYQYDRQTIDIIYFLYDQEHTLQHEHHVFGEYFKVLDAHHVYEHLEGEPLLQHLDLFEDEQQLVQVYVLHDEQQDFHHGFLLALHCVRYVDNDQQGLDDEEHDEAVDDGGIFYLDSNLYDVHFDHLVARIDLDQGQQRYDEQQVHFHFHFHSHLYPDGPAPQRALQHEHVLQIALLPRQAESRRHAGGAGVLRREEGERERVLPERRVCEWGVCDCEGGDEWGVQVDSLGEGIGTIGMQKWISTVSEA
ncbi:hypothetical protein OC844_007320 [Tilletia horrida]|nr:hypothetical protein OC844_007320 [Tilletia horrida]